MFYCLLEKKSYVAAPVIYEYTKTVSDIRPQQAQKAQLSCPTIFMYINEACFFNKHKRNNSNVRQYLCMLIVYQACVYNKHKRSKSNVWQCLYIPRVLDFISHVHMNSRLICLLSFVELILTVALLVFIVLNLLMYRVFAATEYPIKLSSTRNAKQENAVVDVWKNMTLQEM